MSAPPAPRACRRPRIIFRHALPNAILPIIAMIGIDIGQFMGGVVVVESVFGWPGIGQLAWQAIQQVDIPIIMGVTLTSALAIVIGNLLADLIAPLIDPRIRYTLTATKEGEPTMFKRWLRTTTMATMVALAPLPVTARNAKAGRRHRRHLQGRHRHARPGHRLRLGQLVDDQEPLFAPDGLRRRAHRTSFRRLPRASTVSPDGLTYHLQAPQGREVLATAAKLSPPT